MKSLSFLYNNGKWNKELPLLESQVQNTLILLFGNDLGLIESLIQKYKKYKIIGTTTAGNINNGLYNSVSADQSTVSMVVLEFEKTEVKVFSSKIQTYDDSFVAGQKMFESINQYPELSGSIVFMEGLNFNGAQFSAGIDSVNSKKIPVIGASSADDMLFNKTLVFSNEGILENSTVGVGFYGKDFKMFMDSDSGVIPFGIERKITKCDKNVLYELDKKPALDLYEEFLGEKSVELPASGLHFPVEISENFEKKEGLVRTPIAIDRENKSITFTGEIPLNGYLRLLTASRESLSNAAEKVGENCLKHIPDNIFKSKKFFNLMITCAARRQVLGRDNIDDEIVPTFELMGSVSDNSAGFYSYGEIVSVNNECCFANQTMSQCVFFEE